MLYVIGSAITAIIWILGVGYLRAKREIPDDFFEAMFVMVVGIPFVLFWPAVIFLAFLGVVSFSAVKLSTYIMKRFV